jgi:hypothetical protein
VLVIIEANAPDWREAERRLIAEARARGERLLNVADGGDEPHCPTATRAKNGRAVAAAIQADPTRRMIWDLKRRIGKDMKDGFVSNSARAKLRKAAQLRPDLFGVFANLPDREENPDGSPVGGYGRAAA